MEEDTLAYMNGWADETFVDGERLGYSLPLTQATSDVIPSSYTFGDCYSDSSFKVAIIDSGIMFDHPDSPCMDSKAGTNCVGRSFGTNDDWDWALDSWHATHILGIMGALGGNVRSIMPTDNNICWVFGQVFPDSASSEIPTYLSSVYKAAMWSIGSKGAKVVNMSLSGGYTETGKLVMDYAQEKNAIVVAGAGNSHTFQYEYPSSYANDILLSVGSVDAERYVLLFVR
jgi:subtilisin family serine protease